MSMTLRKQQAGLTIVELMVSMTLGLLLTIAIAQIFLGTRQTYASQDENARMQETARFALQLIERELRMSGFVRNGSTGTYSVASPVIAAADDSNPSGAGLNDSDEFTVRFFGSDDAAGTAADNTVINCIGESARLNETVVDRFYIAAGASGEPALFCRSIRPSNTAVTTDTELVSGVESMQLLFGEDTNADRTADRYLGRNDVALDMERVVSVRISLLVRSAQQVATGADTRKYNHFGTAYAAADTPPASDAGAVFNSAGASLDRRLRRLYQTTVALRNRVN